MNKLDTSKLKPKNISLKNIKLKGKITKKKVIVFLIIILIVGIAVVMKLKAPKLEAQAECITLEKTNISNNINVLGEVESDNSTNVYTNSANIVKEVKVNVGDKVKKGDVLAVLDTEKLEKEISQMKEALNTSQGNAKVELDSKKSAYDNAVYINENNLNVEVVNADAAVESTKRDLADKEKIYEYNKTLLGYGEISAQDLNKCEMDYKNAQAEYDKSVVAQENVKLKIEENLNSVKSAYEAANIAYGNKSERIALENKEKELQECIIKAPEDGTITVINAVVGNPSTGNLFTIEDLDNINIKASIKEVDVANVKVGQKTSIKTDSMEDEELEGEVKNINPTAKKEKSIAGEAASSSDVSFEAEVKMKEPNDKIKIGMKAKVNIVLDEKNDVYAVPYENIVDDENGSSVYIAEKQGDKYVVKQIPVNIGMESDFKVEISGDGIEDGIFIISNPSTYSVGSNIEIKGGEASE